MRNGTRPRSPAWIRSPSVEAFAIAGTVLPKGVEALFDRLPATTGDQKHSPVLESFLVELGPDSIPTAEFDRVVLSELDVRSVELVALAIGQSVGMEYYEDSIDQLISQLEHTSRQLAETGRFRGKNRELLSFIGRGMTTRTQVVHTLALLDAPALAPSFATERRAGLGVRAHALRPMHPLRAALAPTPPRAALVVKKAPVRKLLWVLSDLLAT